MALETSSCLPRLMPRGAHGEKKEVQPNAPVGTRLHVLDGQNERHERGREAEGSKLVQHEGFKGSRAWFL